MSPKIYKVNSFKQLEALVKYMGRHRDFALRALRGKEAQSLRNHMWRDLTGVLNVLEGCQRNQLGWQKVWTELKHKVKHKALKIRKAKKLGLPYTGPALTGLEERVMQVFVPGYTAALLNDPDSSLIEEYLQTDNETQDSVPSPAGTDFCDIKAIKTLDEDDASESDPENSKDNPLNTTDSALEPQESVRSPQRRSPPRTSPPKRSPPINIIEKKDRKRSFSFNSRKSSRTFRRKFKRIETLNEFDVYGKHVSSQLKLLPTKQAILAQAEIQSILTKYRLESLNNGTSNNNGQHRDQMEFIETVYEEVDKESQSSDDHDDDD